MALTIVSFRPLVYKHKNSTEVFFYRFKNIYKVVNELSYLCFLFDVTISDKLNRCLICFAMVNCFRHSYVMF